MPQQGQLPVSVVRATYEEDVARPGKFEGEAPYVPYFWERLDESDDEDCGTVRWAVTAEDRTVFPELVDRKDVYLLQTNDGFIYEVDGFPDGTEDEGE